MPNASDLTPRSAAGKAKAKERRRKERKVKERAKAKAAKERAAATSTNGGSSDPSMVAGTTVVAMTMDCMSICLADLPLPPAALRLMTNLHYLHLKFIQFVRVIMKVRSMLFNRFLVIARMPLHDLVYASGLVYNFFLAGVSGIVIVFIKLGTCLMSLVR